MPLSLEPEYRRDPVVGRWVIIAPERSLRPLALSHSKPHARWDAERDSCPFCEGHENQTPSEVYAVRMPGSEPNGLGWRLRVVPNRFPAVRSHPETNGNAPIAKSELFQALPGEGTHELVLECSLHKSNPTTLTDNEFRDVFIAYRERCKVLSANKRHAYVTVFKNVGAEAGASLAHLHSQIVATPIVPDAVQLELAGAAHYHQHHANCVFCDLLAAEQQAKLRVITETEHFLAFAPFASRFAYETWVLPKVHESRYETLSDVLALELARLMKYLLSRLDAILGMPAYNYFLHMGPARAPLLAHYHWHLELVPRTARAAGFEWGAGCFINSVRPERAAKELREAKPLPDDDIFG